MCEDSNDDTCSEYVVSDAALDQNQNNVWDERRIYENAADRACITIADDILVPDPRSCQRYFRCYSQQSFAETCPEGYAFSEENQRCDPEDEVDCIQCPLHRNVTRQSDPKNCNYYFTCVSGSRKQLACTANQRYDNATQKCKPRHEVQCNVDNVCRHHKKSEENFLVRDLNDCRK